MITAETTTLVLRLMLAHTALLTAAPYVQGLSSDPGAWRDNIPLLVSFLLAPLTAGYLVRSGNVRIGSVLLLSFMPAGVYANVVFLRTAAESAAARVMSPAWHIVHLAILSFLVIIQVTSAILSAGMLRNVHQRATLPPEA